jgi:hypothetical protein
MNDFDWIKDIQVEQSLLTENLDESNLVVIGARCGHAKTWVLSNIGIKYYEMGKNVLHISMGEPTKQVVNKYKRIKDNWPHQENQLLIKYFPYYTPQGEKSTTDLDTIIEYIKRANDINKFDIILLDNPYEFISSRVNVGGPLRGLSCELDIPIVMTIHTVPRPQNVFFHYNTSTILNADKLMSLTFYAGERRLDVSVQKNRHGDYNIKETYHFNDNWRLWL